MTIKQKQCLLAYLGYYTGAIDGIWGDKSLDATVRFQDDFCLPVDGICGADTEKALRHAVAYGMPTFETEDEPESDDFWKNDPPEFFTKPEFACPCPRCGGFPAEPNVILVRVTDRVRGHFGSPADVSSGVRCQKHNDELPNSVPNSRHVVGKAVDFRIRGKSAAEVLAYVQKQPEVRYAYAIDGSYVHMDVE